MARKQDEELVELAETGVVVAIDDDDDKPFTLGKWNGLTQWRCRFCAWDTLDGEGEAMDHYIARHAAPVASQKSPILRVDRFGRPVR